MTVSIKEEDLRDSISEALQFISYYHPVDYIQHLAKAYEREESPEARNAIGQILINSRMAAMAKRPICQDTGAVTIFLRLGQEVRLSFQRSLTDVVNDGVAKAYLDADNPLRASIVRDPLTGRKNTMDNTPAVVHVEVTPGDKLAVTVVAKGGGSENKARFYTLNPNASVADWVVQTMEGLGAGWCPPGVLGIGVGGNAEMAMLLAKKSLLEKIDMLELLARGPSNPIEEMRIDIYNRVNALGIGAQGLGGLTSVVDVKIASYPCHAASMPVALIPQCAANRHIEFVLDGSGPATFTPPRLADWPEVSLDGGPAPRRVDLDALTREEIASWRAGELVLLSGKMLTGRDAAHQRIARMLAEGRPLPVSFAGRSLYYVGPVRPVGDEVVGPAGPTTANRMDAYTEMMLGELGLLVMIGKAERGPEAIESIVRHGAAYLIAVGGAAYLVSRAIKSARLVAFEDLGMEAIYEFEVKDMPVTVAVDGQG
ncbi:MAG TPA: fumarate hydratase, partial [Caulobacteraceae bacterium]|nr:fumarate hydratase [Caulobacteraceae bacterium]